MAKSLPPQSCRRSRRPVRPGTQNHATSPYHSAPLLDKSATTMLEDDELQATVARLRSMVGAVCHPSSAEFEPLIPRCSPDRRLIEFPSGLTEAQEAEFVTQNVIGACITVCCVALAAGLFLGLMTLDLIDLQIIVRSSADENEIKYAKRLIPIVTDRHRLLVTLLIFSTLAYETLPIFLDSLMSGWVAVLSSTVLVLLFGEIVPSGIFTGQHQLFLGYYLAPLVQFFLYVLYPIAKPLGKVLDFLVPQDIEAEVYNRGELSALVRIQHEKRAKPRSCSSVTKAMKYVINKDRHWNDLKAEIIEKANDLEVVDEDEFPEAQLTPPLHQREVDMVEGALKMRTKLAMDVYTPLNAIYAVPDDLVLDKATITTIYSHGFSRVPVFRRNPDDPEDHTAITGYLMTRQLMLIDWEDMRILGTLPLQRPTCVHPRINLIDLMHILQTNGPVLTFVCARPDLANRTLRAHLPIPVEAGLLGLITIVDIMESVLQDRMYDERDIQDQNRALATLNAWAATKLQAVFRRKYQRKKQGNTGASQAGSANGSNDGTTNGSPPRETTPLLWLGDDSIV